MNFYLFHAELLTESPDEYPSCSTTSTPLSNIGRRSSYKYGKGMVKGIN